MLTTIDNTYFVLSGLCSDPVIQNLALSRTLNSFFYKPRRKCLCRSIIYIYMYI